MNTSYSGFCCCLCTRCRARSWIAAVASDETEACPGLTDASQRQSTYWTMPCMAVCMAVCMATQGQRWDKARLEVGQFRCSNSEGWFSTQRVLYSKRHTTASAPAQNDHHTKATRELERSQNKLSGSISPSLNEMEILGPDRRFESGVFSSSSTT